MKTILKADENAFYKIPIFLSWQQILQYVYIIDERNNELFFIEDIGMEIWLQISNCVKISDIVKYLHIKYKEFDKEEVRNVVVEFINELLEGGFIYER